MPPVPTRVVHPLHLVNPRHFVVAGSLVAALLLSTLADAWRPLVAIAGAGPLWLEIAAAVLLAAAVIAGPRARGWEAWSTPLDGRILAGIAVAVLQALPSRPDGFGVLWLRQMLACGGAYYAFVVLLRRRPDAVDALWVGFPVAAVALGVHALWAATQGLQRLAIHSAIADTHWGSHHGLAKALAFATLVTAGRAWERDVAPAWRVSALVGVAGCVMHAATGGLGLGASALARLDDPLYFSSTCVTMLLVLALVRLAWDQRRERPGQAWRWRMLAAAFGGLVVFGLFGETSGGEGVRALAVLGATLAVIAREAPAPGGPDSSGELAPLAHAA